MYLLMLIWHNICHTVVITTLFLVAMSVIATITEFFADKIRTGKYDRSSWRRLGVFSAMSIAGGIFGLVLCTFLVYH